VSAGWDFSDALVSPHPRCFPMELVRNAGFELPAGGGPLDVWKPALLDPGDGQSCSVGNCELTLAGDGSAKRLQQTARVAGEAGDTLVLTASSSASGVPAGDAPYGVRVTVFHEDGSREIKSVRFSSGTHGVETLTKTIETNEAWKKVRVEIRYGRSGGTVRFDDVSLTFASPPVPRQSCREILDADESTGDGLYALTEGAEPPYLAYCDMVTNGGGWTVVFAGRNGSTNVFDHFDATSYDGICIDPSAQCLRHAPPSLGDAAAELAVTCRGAMVTFPVTTPVLDWLTEGIQVGWTQLTPTVLAGTVHNVPNTLWTGSAASESFIFSRNSGTFENTFASSYDASSIFDNCNNRFDQASLVRVFYREVAPTPVRNTPATAGRTCRAILDAGDSDGDGIYWLAEPMGAPYQAYCDMTTDGGGWTGVFAGRNGSNNVFGRFDSPTYEEFCPDPASRCLRRAPSSLGNAATELGVSCGDAMVSFALTNGARDLFAAGTRSGWIPLTPRVLAGTVPTVPNSLYTGVSAVNGSFIFARNNGTFLNTFAQSYGGSTFHDYCNGLDDQASLVRVFYREVAPAPVLNTMQNARQSCLDVLEASESLGDGIYWLVEPGGSPYQAYCDMTTDGGGWTAVFAGRNGSPNVFDHFDSTSYAGICTDPATRCLRRAPASLGTVASELAVSCGGAAVKFPLTAAASGWLTTGAQAGWVALTPTVVAGSVVNVPNTLYTGASASNQSFIFARNSSTFENTFASSRDSNDWSDYCNNVADQASLVRVLYR